MVPKGGLEPPRPLRATDFKSVTSTIPSLGQNNIRKKNLHTNHKGAQRKIH